MNLYTGMLALLLVLALLMQGHRQGNKSYIWIACTAMFVVMGFRDALTIGNDSASSYLHNFQDMAELTWQELMTMLSDSHNPGLPVVMKLVHVWTDGDYQVFTILFNGFNMAVFGWFLNKYSVDPVQSIIYYCGLIFYTFMADIMKQSIAMSLLLVAFDAIVERRPIRFVLLVWLAYLFHAPAMIFLPAYLIAKMQPNRMYLLFLVVMLVLTYRFRNEILELMLEFYETDVHDASLSFLANKVLIMIVIVVAALVLRPPEEQDRVYGILMQFMGISIVLQTFASYNNTFERLANYYFQFAVAFIPMVFQTDTRRSRLLDIKTEAMAKQAAPWAFCAFGVWRFARYISSTSWIWLPYRFFFE